MSETALTRQGTSRSADTAARLRGRLRIDAWDRDAAFRVVEAIALKGGRITAAGTSAAVLKEEIDAPVRTLPVEKLRPGRYQPRRNLRWQPDPNLATPQGPTPVEAPARYYLPSTDFRERAVLGRVEVDS